MRKIEFVPNLNGFTKILLDSVELKTRINPYDIREYRYHLGKQYSIGYAYHIIETHLALLVKEISLDADETAFVIKYLKRELGI